jgi:D-lactate dehydrogenase
MAHEHLDPERPAEPAAGGDPAGRTILFAEAAAVDAAALRVALAEAGVPATVRLLDEPVRDGTAPGLGPGVEVLSVFVGSRVGGDVLEACPDLRLVATRSTGFDHVDVDACSRRGIAVANVPTYGENTVAEHTFALILALSRNVHKAWVRTQRHDFSLAGLRGFDLRGRTLGVVGTGHIGLHVTKIGRGFGMDVVASDPRPQPLLAEVIGFRYTTLPELAACADIVTLHAPYTAATHHLVDRALLARFKRGALLVNTARGALVDTDALLWALDEGILRGAGLDVLEGEEVLTEDRRLLAARSDEAHLRTLVGNQELMGRENVVVTPHIGFDSAEAVQRIQDVTVRNILAFLRGRPENLLDAAATA